MSENRLMVLSTLEEIEKSIKLILSRFAAIKTSDDFLADEAGMEKLDSICMRLLAIGEGFKNIDKLTDSRLLEKYPSIEWKNIKGLRDVLSHHYFDLNAEIIFDICSQKLEPLLRVVSRMIGDLSR